jgi:PAS domain S-box-containing protein
VRVKKPDFSQVSVVTCSDFCVVQMNRNSKDEAVHQLCASLVEEATEGIFIAGSDGQIIHANSAAHKLFGYAGGELIGVNIDALVPKKRGGHDSPHGAGAHASYRATYHGAPEKKPMGRGRDLRGLKKGGLEFPVEVSLTPLARDGQHLVAAIVTDISSRKAKEEEVLARNEDLGQQVSERTQALLRSQHLYSAVTRNYPNGTISVLDEELRYVLIEGRELFAMNITSEELKGSPYIDHLPEDIRPEIEGYLREAQEGEIKQFELEFRGEHYLIDALPLDMEGLNERLIMVVEQNISEVRKAIVKERHLNELKSRFVSMASHEFRTPLSTISSSAELAAIHVKAGKKDRAGAHLSRIKNSVQHLVTILDDYLSLEKFEEGGWQVGLEPMDYAGVLKGVVIEQRANLKSKQTIEIVWGDLPPAGEQSIGIPAALKGITGNLLTNASKYSDDGARIELAFGRENGQWLLSVKDEGVGIAKDELAQVFKRFFRSNSTTHIPGTGVGLDLVRRYVKALGGQVEVKSKVGEGAVFTAFWPVVEQMKTR